MSEMKSSRLSEVAASAAGLLKALANPRPFANPAVPVPAMVVVSPSSLPVVGSVKSLTRRMRLFPVSPTYKISPPSSP
eukprot:3730396-Pyramimonas_sp.AAC.3